MPEADGPVVVQLESAPARAVLRRKGVDGDYVMLRDHGDFIDSGPLAVEHRHRDGKGVRIIGRSLDVKPNRKGQLLLAHAHAAGPEQQDEEKPRTHGPKSPGKRMHLQPAKCLFKSLV
jgi:hypothetical protein